MAVHRSDRARDRPALRLESLLGRAVHAANGRVVGRLEEVRAEPKGRQHFVTEYVIGPAGLLERLGLGIRNLLGWRWSGYIARWDQLDVSDPEHLRLTCTVDALTRVG
jgi:hypothetical protein